MKTDIKKTSPKKTVLVKKNVKKKPTKKNYSILGSMIGKIKYTADAFDPIDIK